MTSNEPKDLSKDEVVELVSMVKKEISGRKYPERLVIHKLFPHHRELIH